MRLMLDESLPSLCNPGNRALHPAKTKLILSMSSLLDQSALTDLAERLVAAARRAGADAADALAVRSVSVAGEVRDGAVEESERPEGDDAWLRACGERGHAVARASSLPTY